MIVDDAEMNREILMVILGDEYEYVQAENGRQAIHILQQDMNIDLSQSYMVGDGENDIKAGKAAGCKTVLLNTECECYGQDICVGSLKDFVDQYLR